MATRNATLSPGIAAEKKSTSISIGRNTERNNTFWTKEPEPDPDYSDWTIILGWKGDTGTSSKNANNRDPDEPVNKKRKISNEKNYEEIDEKCQNQHQNRPKSYRYCVHRNLVGPKSKYFSSVFLSQQRYAESNANESFIQFSEHMYEETFHAVAGEAFQVILNHCYLNDDTNQIHEETTTTVTNSTLLSSKAPGLNKINAPIVICLCDYFQIDGLSKIAKQSFMRDRRQDSASQRDENVCVDDLIRIYECAKELRCDFNVDDIEAYVIDECLDDPSQLLFGKNRKSNNDNHHNETVADVADFRFWKMLFTEYYRLRKNYVYSEKLVKDFSLALVSYLEEFEQLRQSNNIGDDNNNNHDDNGNYTSCSVVEVLDGLSFQQLLDNSAFSVVSEHAAISLLRFEEFYSNGCRGDDENGNKSDSQLQQLTNLQQRCVDALDKSSWCVLTGQQQNQESFEEDEDKDGTKNEKMIDVATLRKKLGNLKCTSLILQSLLIKSVGKHQQLENQNSQLQRDVEHLQQQVANLRRRNRELRARELGIHKRREEESTVVSAHGPAPSTSNQRTRRGSFRDEELFSRRM